MDPITAVSAAATLARIIADLNRGDGGISAMLSTQIALLNVIINQLQAINTALEEIFIKINELPSQLREITSSQSAFDLISSIRGYARQYQNILKVITSNPAVASDPQINQDIANIRTGIRNARSTLAFQPYGGSPLAALVYPTACGVELNAGLRLGEPTDLLRQELIDYITWADAMLVSANDYNVTGYINKATQDQKKVLDDLRDSAVGKITSLLPGRYRLLSVYCPVGQSFWNGGEWMAMFGRHWYAIQSEDIQNNKMWAVSYTMVTDGGRATDAHIKHRPTHYYHWDEIKKLPLPQSDFTEFDKYRRGSWNFNNDERAYVYFTEQVSVPIEAEFKWALHEVEKRFHDYVEVKRLCEPHGEMQKYNDLVARRNLACVQQAFGEAAKLCLCNGREQARSFLTAL